tara:strand:+ start:104 stop:766 length:663 start_codon:yes stop_codon:yes gene_type:complete
MATINVNRQGVGTGIGNGIFSKARTNAASAVTDGVTGSGIVQYFTSGRTKRFSRAFLHFDTSGITGTLSAAHIDITGDAGNVNPNDTIMIKSTAFGGDGGTALATLDHYNSLDYGTAYSDELSTWNSSGNNEFTLTAAALADIKNNDHFTLAIIDHDNDYADSDATATADVSIDFDVTITLDYTAAASGYTHDVNSVAASSINKVNSVATASIGKINSVD